MAPSAAALGSLLGGGSGGGGTVPVGPEAHRALPLAPPPDLPLYLPSPAARAGAMARQAAAKAQEAAIAAGRAASASTEASTKAGTAEVASAKAVAIYRALARVGYVDDMVNSLNRTLTQVMHPPDADAPAMEVRDARDLVRRSHKLKLMADDDVHSLQGALERDRKRLSPEVQQAMGNMISRLKVHQEAVSEIDRMTKKQLKLLETEERPAGEPPFLPPALRHADGSPRWPQRLPPPELPSQQDIAEMAKRFL
mmetsp:Transcript_115275/g.337020  ORF Transcript_115275/g.337020 Transcript_115275/m.337020 type:complete len:254 (+) Transcript_115275:31-792(+)